ncbi:MULTISPECIES: FkbM family methyltransferase [unclassified Janibacter]|uniref:FkbM family methyltransferase n=1 Tax=unclassified Janibacter TaxID=2649294 RepID=UPI003CFE84E3
MSSGQDQRRRLSAPFRPRNYRAFAHTLTTYRRPVDALDRYVRGTGDYPWHPVLRTPIGEIELVVPHPHDVRTVNEVFCRRDYGSGAPEVVVDVGGNIGVSAAWFLSRTPTSRVYVWEPVPHNLESLRANTAAFGDRCTIHPTALAPVSGPATFLIDPVGRYSGLAQYRDSASGAVPVEVECEAVGEALRGVLEREGRIDLVKVDTEGSEEAIVAAIPADIRAAIGEIVYEYPGGVRRLRLR